MFDWSQSDLIVLPISLGVIIVISILLCVLFKNKSAQTRSIPLMVIAATILVLEVIKQVKAIAEGYGFWTFPLHFCIVCQFMTITSIIQKNTYFAMPKTVLNRKKKLQMPFLTTVISS